MAIYYANVKPLSRSDGRSAVAAAAYRAGVRLEDARTGLVFDYSRRSGVAVSEILTPDGSPADRAQLWNAAEAAERRKDARTGREWVLALPTELDAAQRHELARGFSLELVRRYGVAVDMAIHEPSKAGDERNHHVHVFATTRRVRRDDSGALVMGEKAACELSDHKRKALDPALKPAAEEVTELRQLWERLANEALERAGRAERIDSRSLEAQGIDREPTTHLGPAATAMERRGEPSELGEVNRQVEARNAEREAVQAEIIDLKAERDRRAQEAQAQREREEVEAATKAEAARLEEARQERARDVARWEGMGLMERRREAKRLQPPALDTLIEQDDAMKAAQRRQQEAEALRDRAAQEVQTWRAQGRAHRAWAWLHSRGLVRSSEFGALESRREETRSAAEEAARSLEATHKATTVRLTEAQRPAQERFEAFLEVDARKREEAAQEALRKAQARKEAEERAKALRAREEAQRAAREAARRAEARKAEEQALAAQREAARKVEAERAAVEKRQRIAEAEAFKADPAAAQKEHDRRAAALAKLPEGPERQTARQHLAEFEGVTGTRERSPQEIERERQNELHRKMLEDLKARKQREKDRGWDRDR